MPAKELRAMYDDVGLACCGMHLATDALLGDNLQRTIEINQILACSIYTLLGRPRCSGNR